MAHENFSLPFLFFNSLVLMQFWAREKVFPLLLAVLGRHVKGGDYQRSPDCGPTAACYHWLGSLLSLSRQDQQNRLSVISIILSLDLGAWKLGPAIRAMTEVADCWCVCVWIIESSRSAVVSAVESASDYLLALELKLCIRYDSPTQPTYVYCSFFQWLYSMVSIRISG